MSRSWISSADCRSGCITMLRSLLQALERALACLAESARIALPIGGDRRDDEAVAGAAVKRAPRAAASSWAQLPQPGRAAYITCVGIGQARAECLQLLYRVVDRRSLLTRQFAAFLLGRREVVDGPHLQTIPRLISGHGLPSSRWQAGQSPAISAIGGMHLGGQGGRSTTTGGSMAMSA